MCMDFFNFSFQVGFRAVRAEEYSGDIALDSIVVRSGPCPVEYGIDYF